MNKFTSTAGCFELTQTTRAEVMEALAEVSEFLENTKKSIVAAENVTWESVMLPFQKAVTNLGCVEGRFVGVFVYSIANDEYRAIYDEISPKLAELNRQFFGDIQVMNKLLQLKKSPEGQSLSPVKKEILNNFISSGEDEGLFLDEATRATMTKIAEEIDAISVKFNNNAYRGTQNVGLVVKQVSDLGFMPLEFKELASKQYADKFKIISTTDTGPWYFSPNSGLDEVFLKYSPNRELKKTLFIAANTIASSGEWDNTECILKLLSLRGKQAKVFGFDNFFDYSLRNATAKKENINYICNKLLSTLKAKGEQYRSCHKRLAAAENILNLEPWDIAYFERKRVEENLFAEEEVKEYFPFLKVLSGLLSLTTKLFSLSFVEDEMKKWNSEVTFYWVKNSAGEKIAGFYIDPYMRPGEKIAGTQNVGAFCADLTFAARENGELEIPICLLSFGFNAPTQNQPSLLSIGNIGSLFHEFGHFMATVLSSCENSCSGVRHLKSDITEFESSVFEFLARDYRILKNISCHFKTQAILPEHLLQPLAIKLQEERIKRAYSLLFLTELSIKLYSEFSPEQGNLGELSQAVNQQLFVPPFYEGDKSLWKTTPLFTLNGYLASCYMYLWASAVAHTYLENIDFAKATDAEIRVFGEKLKQTLYANAHGGDAMAALKQATGRELPNFASFAQSFL